MNKMPEYSPEYRPEMVVLPATHRGGIDDDKGPIHTIPAPNLSPADKPYNPAADPKETSDRRPYPSDLNYHTTAQSKVLRKQKLYANSGTVERVSDHFALHRIGKQSVTCF